jgi:DNA-nicking Smr family endonuclease
VKRHDQADTDDLAAFHASVAGSIPLRQQQRVVFEPAKPSPRPRSLDDAPTIAEARYAPLPIDDGFDLGDVDFFLRPGLPRSVLRDLRGGRWAMQEQVDLHGMNRHEAHEQVSLLLAEALSAGKRSLSIIHGRGHGSPGREGILRQLVKSWLGRHREVLAFCHPLPRDGGDGALWVLLKASRTR